MLKLPVTLLYNYNDDDNDNDEEEDDVHNDKSKQISHMVLCLLFFFQYSQCLIVTDWFLPKPNTL